MSKIEIRNRWTNAVIFTHESEDATLRDAVLAAVRAEVSLRAANLSDADLRDADLRAANLRAANLRAANLSDADLRDADLRAANLSDADLRAANLSDADLTPIRDDIWAILSAAPLEVPALIDALKSGRVDGSTYSGECSCLVGTIAQARDVSVDNLGLIKPNSSRAAERFFMGIRKGDTPETNQFSKLALEWSQQWLSAMQAAFSPNNKEIIK